MRRHSDLPGKAALAVGVFILTMVSALAQSPDASTSERDQWHYVIGLYVWAPAITGTVTTRSFPESTCPSTISGIT